MKKRVVVVSLMAIMMGFALVGCDGLPIVGNFTGTEITADNEESLDEESSDSVTKENSAEEETSELTDGADDDMGLSEIDEYIEYNGNKVSLDDDVQTILDAFGVPDTMEFDNPGYIYTFNSSNIVFFTDELDSVEIPSQIIIDDNNVKTSKGICIGSTMDELKAAYGAKADSDMEASNMCTYTFNNCRISFVINDNDTVTEMIYNKQ